VFASDEQFAGRSDDAQVLVHPGDAQQALNLL
jgi:hypothetical protein